MKEIPKAYQHQNDAGIFIWDKFAWALFMEQGTGKSKVVIQKSFDLYTSGEIDCVIVISPNAVKEQWVTEQYPTHYPSHNWISYLWSGGKSKATREEFVKTAGDMSKLFVFSANVEAFQLEKIDLFIEHIMDRRKVMVVIDESTRIKNGRRKPRRGKRGGAKRTNKIIDLFKNVKYKGILTGTPTPNNPFDLWSQFEFLKFNFFGKDYFSFKHHYGIIIKRSVQGSSFDTVLDEKTFNMVKSRIKKLEQVKHSDVEDIATSFNMKVSDVLTIRGMDKYHGYKNLKSLRDKISEITFFVKKEDCLDLPDKVYEKLYCPLGPVQKKMYQSIKKEMYAELGGKELSVLSKVTLALRLQMITGGLFPWSNTEIKIDKDGDEYFETSYKYEPLEDCGKMKVLLEDLEEVPKDTSIIIWARFRGEIDMIKKSLSEAGYTCRRFYGGSSYEVINEFKNKDFRILIGNTLKGGEGLNLQICTLQYFYSNSFKADSRLQAEDRSHRIGQTNKVTYKDLICKGTVDERVYEVLKRKENLIDYFRTKGDFEFMEEV